MGRRSSDTDRQSAMPQPLSDKNQEATNHGYYLTQTRDVFFVHSFFRSVTNDTNHGQSSINESTRFRQLV